MQSLEDIGYTAALDAAFRALDAPHLVPGRVASVNRNNFDILCQGGSLRAEPTGRLLFAASDSMEVPTVGDWVAMQTLNDDTFGLIHHLLPRRSSLRRKDPGRNVEYQLLGANVDVAFCMQSADRDYNLNRLERYLVMVRDGGIEPVVVLTKADLVDAEERGMMLEGLRETAGDVPCLFISTQDGVGLESVRELLAPGRTACLLGSSGVGKTTLLNALLGGDSFATREVREVDHRGRHTTTRRQLLVLDNGALLIDSPGLRELGSFGADAGFSEIFGDIERLAAECRFKDCTHQHEKGCAIIAAIEAGELDAGHFENYEKMQREAAHYERSYLERRRRDKEFGKMVKRITRDNDKRRR